MAKVEIYTLRTCPYCIKAKEILESKGVRYEEIPVDNMPDVREEMKKRANGRHTVPQIFINGDHVGGCDDLIAADESGKLDRLLKNGGNGNNGPRPA